MTDPARPAMAIEEAVERVQALEKEIRLRGLRYEDADALAALVRVVEHETYRKELITLMKAVSTVMDQFKHTDRALALSQAFYDAEQALAKGRAR